MERVLPEPFVANDLAIGEGEPRLLILTGPNMGGKSTFLRQTALIALMAQMGSFVPAREAKVGVLDRIFTRVGATDHILRGQSTFMVEMQETAHILRHATARSLVLLDEIGRGTATFDGLSIAWAVAEHLAGAAGGGPKTLFATHYHELTDLGAHVAGVGNLHVSAREWQDSVVFLRKIEPGGSDRSFGIQVARLAGLPAAVVVRAQEILAQPGAHRVRPRGPSAPGALAGRRRRPARASWPSSRARRRPCCRSCGGWTWTGSRPCRRWRCWPSSRSGPGPDLENGPQGSYTPLQDGFRRSATAHTSPGACEGIMAIRGWDPLGDILSLQETMNRLLEEALAPERLDLAAAVVRLDPGGRRLRDRRLLRGAHGAARHRRGRRRDDRGRRSPGREGRPEAASARTARPLPPHGAQPRAPSRAPSC